MSSNIRELSGMGNSHAPDTQVSDTDNLLARYHAIRAQSESICDSLNAEDFVIQSMPEASPLRWHLAHTTWFFETFVLSDESWYQPIDSRYRDLFNSYYNHVGKQFERGKRGVLSRPSVEEVFEYRKHVDRAVEQVIVQADSQKQGQLARLIELGLHHEQQHQELMATDLKHAWSHSPEFPQLIQDRGKETASSPEEFEWIEFDEGIYEIGFSGDGFCFDNESPAHRHFADQFAVSNRLITCREYLEFMEDGGYRRPEFWLSMGWQFVTDQRIDCPLYWWWEIDHWMQYTLAGAVPVTLSQPVTHISYFEADAYAKWKGCVLATEQQWEIASRTVPSKGQFLESQSYHPQALNEPSEGNRLYQMFGTTWQWTSSQYSAYPGYQAPDGALGEYNGKFMCNQFVLRGGSCVTPLSHIRHTYRNFFPPETRWQFSGIRLARYL